MGHRPSSGGEKYFLRRPGIEPGPHAWKARILTIELSALTACCNVCGEKKKYFFFFIGMRYPGIEPGPHRWQRRILTTELIALTNLIHEKIIFSSHHKQTLLT